MSKNHKGKNGQNSAEIDNHRIELILRITHLKGECSKEIERKKEFDEKLNQLLFYWEIRREQHEV